MYGIDSVSVFVDGEFRIDKAVQSENREAAINVANSTITHNVRRVKRQSSVWSQAYPVTFLHRLWVERHLIYKRRRRNNVVYYTDLDPVSDMKVLAVLLCVAGCVYGGSVAWPGGIISSPVLRTVLPPQTKTVAYSTTQYINSLPVPYSFGYHPNFAFGIPQVSSFTPVQQAYYPITSASYFPSSSVLYPSLSPLAPELPIGSLPSYPSGIPAGIPSGNPSGPASPSAPESPASDSDSAVVDSAEYPQQQQGQQQDSQPAVEAPASQPSAPQPSPPSFPNFPQIPQIGGGSPSFPQTPQYPQGSLPGFPQLPSSPQFPQFPGPSPSPPSSFPVSNIEDLLSGLRNRIWHP
ncbi:hypothetical protein evm_007202 [Chilo suppressalis]|nr:hypothetical protein evm_007202 [Chilo suppressalis]